MTDHDQPPHRCTLTPDCRRGTHSADTHPCGAAFHQVGDPCQYCTRPLPADQAGHVQPCPHCWQPATIGDLKQFAAEEGWDTTVTVGGEQ